MLCLLSFSDSITIRFSSGCFLACNDIGPTWSMAKMRLVFMHAAKPLVLPDIGFKASFGVIICSKEGDLVVWGDNDTMQVFVMALDL